MAEASTMDPIMGPIRLFAPEWLQGDHHPKVHAYYFKEWRQFEMAFHRHNSTEIMYVISGCCRVDLAPADMGKPEVIAMKRGDFIILNANVSHRLIVEGSCRMLNIEFELSEKSGKVPSLKELSEEEPALLELLRFPQPFALLRDPEGVHHALRSLVLELDATYERGTGTFAQLLLAQLLLHISRLCRESQDRRSSEMEKYVKMSQDYLHQNYDRDIRIADIAAFVSLHPGYLQRIFKAQTRQTLNAYLTTLRMEKAKMLLQRTDIPASDISEYVGIGSRQYFHALFRKHTGCTPVEFRRQMNTHRWNN